MKNLINGNTDLIIVLLTVASIALTFLKIMDVKDFGSFVLMVLSYKFGRNQAITSTI